MQQKYFNSKPQKPRKQVVHERYDAAQRRVKVGTQIFSPCKVSNKKPIKPSKIDKRKERRTGVEVFEMSSNPSELMEVGKKKKFNFVTLLQPTVSKLFLKVLLFSLITVEKTPNYGQILTTKNSFSRTSRGVGLFWEHVEHGVDGPSEAYGEGGSAITLGAGEACGSLVTQGA